MTNSNNSDFRKLPAVDRLLRSEELAVAVDTLGHELVREAARNSLARVRREVKAGIETAPDQFHTPEFFTRLCQEISELAESRSSASLVPVFNLTGTVIHTNLGRAALPANAIDSVLRVSGQPVNLEYDLSKGVRGDRESHVEELLCQLTGAEAATVVNNNAAAVVLVLTTLAVGQEVIISRGELVEIGGAFRIPEVMGSAGCHLKEVGATNRTHLTDYEQAIDENTAILMKVHTSNYEIKGFSQSVPEAEIAALSRNHGLPFVVDLGSGTLIDLSRYGLPREPTVADSLGQGADLVTFSGDKLLGGPQAGIVAGRRELIRQIKKHPLKRALRVDKMTLAALGSVLQLYQNPATLPQNLPVLRDLTRSLSEISALANEVWPTVAEYLDGKADVEVASCKSQIGSGSLPVDLLDSKALKITPRCVSGADSELQQLALEFRQLARPVIGRIHNGSLFLDLRCLWDTRTFCQQLKS